MDPLHAELIRQAADLAREGKRDEARDHLEEVLEQDETNTTAWLLLARITDNPDEKRMALTTVLQLDPGNAKAQDLMSKLDAKIKASAPKDEIMPGISRKTFQLAGGAIVGFIVFMLIGVVVIINNNNRAQAEKDRNATEAVLALTQIKLTETQIAANSTQAAVNLTETLFARVSPTPTPSSTSGLPTLPPTITPTPLPSVTPTLAPITGIPGQIIAWGGRDLRNIGALPILLYSLGSGSDPITLPLDEGTYPSLSPDGQQILYAKYSQTRSSFDVALYDLEGQPVSSILEQAPTLGAYNESTMGSFSRDGSRITFIGTSVSSSDEVYVVLLDGGTIDGVSVLQLTNDTANYSFPSFSPDGSQVVAVRTVTEGDNPGTDLVIIDVNSRTLTPLTNDLNTVRETTPRWSPDGSIIAYAAAGQDDQGTNDLYLIAPSNPGSGFRIVENPANDFLPVFNPDGRFLAFASNRGGAYNIYLQNLTTQQLFQLTDTRDPVYPGGWVNP